MLEPYKTIVVDPPWKYRDTLQGLAGQGAEQHYRTLDAEGITELGQRAWAKWAADDSHLYVWTTNAFMVEAHEMARAWGFTPKTILTWVKTGALGLGRYFRNNTEHVVFAVRGKLMLDSHSLETAFFGQRRRHSEKPGGFYDLAEMASPAPRIDVFARAQRFGWDAWGDEVFTPEGLPSPTELAKAGT